ncbi:MAG: methionine--tRNA ligase subunit beta [Patescibacteria group bacterium]
MITFEDFKKIELRVAKVLTAEKVEGSEKLVRLEVDCGEESKRQIVAGIGAQYTPEELVGKEIVIVANLAPRTLMGLESQGMLLAASGDAGPVLLVPENPVGPGAEVR